MIQIKQKYTQKILIKVETLTGADLMGAVLTGADLREADLRAATLVAAGLANANVAGAILIGANLSSAMLDGADFAGCVVGDTTFGNVDLSAARGLDSVRHSGPSTVGVDTLYSSGAQVPDAFLLGTGVPQRLREAAPSLTARPAGYTSCFISYASDDQEFAERLCVSLQANGVRVWHAPGDQTTANETSPAVDRIVRQFDRVLLILSAHSIDSYWLAEAVELVQEKERRRKETVLVPIRLDDAVQQTRQTWAASMRLQHMADFSRWREESAYQEALDELLNEILA